MKLKASAVTNLTDARYYAAREVDYLGFNLEEGTPGYLDPMYMKAIREWVTGPSIVGEFTRLPVAHVAAAAAFFDLDTVQLTAEHHLNTLAELTELDIILHVDARLSAAAVEQIFRSAAPYVSCFLLDFAENGQWESILYSDATFWNTLFELRPTLLQADLSAEQTLPLFQKLNLSGLSFIGGEEEQVGVKSFDQIEEIFEELEKIG